MEDLETKIKEDLSIDDTNLAGEMKRQPGKFFYWATNKARASAKTRVTKSYLDTVKAETAKKFKEETTKDDPKVRVTERMLDDFLDTDAGIKAAKQSLIDAQYTEEVLESAVEALRQRHFALVELAKSRETETMKQNDYEALKRDFEEREAAKRR